MFKKFDPSNDVSTSTQVKASVQRALKSQIMEAHPKITDEMLDHFALVARWDDMADALLGRYRGVASRVVMYLANEDIHRHPENLPRWGEIAKAVAAA